jgi:hypothetical protein
MQTISSDTPTSSNIVAARAPQANSLFAIEAGAHPATANPFADTRRVTLPAMNGQTGQIEVFAGPRARVETYFDDRTGCRAYFWGLAGHLDVSRTDLLGWIVDAVHDGNEAALRGITGIYIVLIDDPANGRIKMVCDVMGLAPWFIGQQDGRLVCGSDVWSIQDAGLNSGGVNYDAVASWLLYNFDCTGQSLLADFPQMGHGVIGTWEDGKYTESRYAHFIGADNTPPLPELVENIHGGLSRSFDAITRELDRVQIALSGGYDSRYLAALASRRNHLDAEAFCVQDREAEGLAAYMAAERLGIRSRILLTDGSLWNVFDEPHHFTAGGFPMTKQNSYVAASQRPGIPCINGFIGDPMIRGTLDRADKKLERDTSEDLPVAFQRIHRLNHAHARFDLFNGDIIRHCDDRTLATWRKQMALWTHTGHAFAATSLFVRQRHYLANNFLQHRDIAEAIVPFAAFEVIQFKLGNDASCYGWETYEALFRTFFPEIAHIPHNTKMGSKNDLIPRTSRFTKGWAQQVLWGMTRSGYLSMLNRRKTFPRLVGALIGRRDLEVVALFAYRLLLLEQRLRHAKMAFDWNAI